MMFVIKVRPMALAFLWWHTDSHFFQFWFRLLVHKSVEHPFLKPGSRFYMPYQSNDRTIKLCVPVLSRASSWSIKYTSRYITAMIPRGLRFLGSYDSSITNIEFLDDFLIYKIYSGKRKNFNWSRPWFIFYCFVMVFRFSKFIIKG